MAAEWDYDKNNRQPDEYRPSRPEKVSLIRGKGHRWMARVENRTRRKQGCPYCCGRAAAPSKTDIVILHPETVRLWDYENIKTESNRKVWYICHKGHSWSQQVKKLSKGAGCPYCLNHSIIEGENDFAALAQPDVLA